MRKAGSALREGLVKCRESRDIVLCRRDDHAEIWGCRRGDKFLGATGARRLRREIAYAGIR